MYPYNRRRISIAGVIFFIVLFTLIIIGSAWFLFHDKGMFWDYLPFICIPSALINLILLIFYFAKRSFSGYVFTLFFVVFLAGIILSSLFGPFKLYHDGMDAYESSNYDVSAEKFRLIIENYPSSRYAEDSTKNIAYSYYLNGSYQDAIAYFNLSIDKNYINIEDLEIKKILAESYYKLAEEHYSKKQYEAAGENFLNSVLHFTEISEKFPNTNEAFVAGYKIPEFLFKAAKSLKNSDRWADAVQVLEKLKTNYPESEFVAESDGLLFDIYSDRSEALKNDGKYKDSILEFVNIFSLGSKTIESNQYLIKYRFNQLTKNINDNILVQTANETYFQKKYEHALFLFNFIYDNRPDMQETIAKNFVESRLETIPDTSLESYSQMNQSKPTGFFKKEGTSMVSFENKTEYRLNIFISGPDYNVIKLETESKAELIISAGDYIIFTEPAGAEINPFYGKITYDEGAKYREVFSLESEIEEN